MYKTLDLEVLDKVSGGHPLESVYADDDLHRAGVSYVNTVFGYDKYYLGSTPISKELAMALRARSADVWKKYAKAGDYIGYAREWKEILLCEYELSWNGEIGSNSFEWY
ncbi:MAG: hypothetical protein IKG30_08580 [Clostridiales bacterium]|nr:hypothetical protein [Clostridiales bacterium]